MDETTEVETATLPPVDPAALVAEYRAQLAACRREDRYSERTVARLSFVDRFADALEVIADGGSAR